MMVSWLLTETHSHECVMGNHKHNKKKRRTNNDKKRVEDLRTANL